MLDVVERRDLSTVDPHLDHPPGHAHGQCDPLADGHGTGKAENRLPVPTVPPEHEAAARLERDLVTGEGIGPVSRMVDLEDQPGIAALRRGEEDLDAHLAGGQQRPVGHQLRTGTGVGRERAIVRNPPAAECRETLQGERPRRFLEALAEDHLAVETAVNLVVHVLDARAVE